MHWETAAWPLVQFEKKGETWGFASQLEKQLRESQSQKERKMTAVSSCSGRTKLWCWGNRQVGDERFPLYIFVYIYMYYLHIIISIERETWFIITFHFLLKNIQVTIYIKSSKMHGRESWVIIQKEVYSSCVISVTYELRSSCLVARYSHHHSFWVVI